MTVVHVNVGSVSRGEMARLSIGQVVILAAMRQLRSREQVANLFGKEVETVRIMLIRISKKGIRP